MAARLTDDPPEDRLLWGIDHPGNDEDCWPWLGAHDGCGYGFIRVNGRHVRTHRYSYQLHNGPIPEGKLVLHRCDNPPCCNPKHLFLGTDQDNAADSIRKGRRPAKLTEAQVVELRVRYAQGGTTQTALADEYGIRQSYVSSILTGRRRQHVR